MHPQGWRLVVQGRREGVFDADSSRGLSYLPRETVRIDREDIGVLEVNRSGSVAEQEQQEMNSFGVVDEIAVVE